VVDKEGLVVVANLALIVQIVYDIELLGDKSLRLESQ